MSIVANGTSRIVRRRRGLTLIEAAMVLTILALVIAGVMLYYQSATTSNKTQEAGGQLAAIQEAVRTMYSGQATFAGLNNANIQSALPPKMSFGGAASGNLRHSFNGAVTVASANAGGQADSGFTVQFDGIPVDACYRLATKDLGRSVTNLSINGTAGAVPRAPAAAQADCGNGGSATMIWTFF